MWEAISANKRRSTVLILVMAALLMLMGYGIGLTLDPDSGGFFGVVGAAGVWIFLMATAFTGGERILLATSGAHEVTHTQAPQLHNVVEEMQIAAGLPATPRVFIIDSDVPNAFAVGLSPDRAAVAVTTGLLARLNRDELQGVIAHEIGHIANRDTLFMTLAGMTMGAVILLADIYLRGLWRVSRRRSSRSGGQAAAIMAIVAVILAVLAPILARLLYFACSRRREYLADASSAQFTRYPEGLASALEKIASAPAESLHVSRAVAPMMTVNPLAAAGSAASLFSTHPPTADRVRVLRAMTSQVSIAGYEEAYKSLHGNRGVVGAANLAASQEAGRRSALEPSQASPAQQLRLAQDVFNQAARYATVACACGLRIKLPPAFEQKTVVCPRCGTRHDVPRPGQVAATLQTVRVIGAEGKPNERPVSPARRPDH